MSKRKKKEGKENFGFRMSESKGESKGESKSESKVDVKDDHKADAKGASQITIVDLVQEFCLSADVEAAFEQFAENHMHVFAKATEFREGDEHPLEFYNIYEEYLKIFERKIENMAIS